MMSKKYTPSFKMFGLQRSCTNVVIKGLKANFLIVSRELGREWKHGPIQKSATDTHCIVCCFRQPLAWLVSMYRFNLTSGDIHGCPHFQPDWTLTDFLHNQHYTWPTPLDRWNELNRHYLDWVDAHPDQGIIVRSEDMMSPESARNQYLRIGEHFSLRRQKPDEEIYVFTKRVTQAETLQGSMEFDYYEQHRYMDEYSDDVRDTISQQIDTDLLERLDYTELFDSLLCCGSHA